MRALALAFVALGSLALAQTTTPPPTMTPAEARVTMGEAIDDMMLLNSKAADEYFHGGEWEKAIAAFERNIELNPQQVEPYALAAWLLWGTDKARAVTYYDRLVAANPYEPRAYYEVGSFYFINKRDYAEAAKWLQQAVALGLGLPEKRMYGHCLSKLDRRDEALAFWQGVLKEDPTDAFAQKEVERLKNPPPPVTPPPAA